MPEDWKRCGCCAYFKTDECDHWAKKSPVRPGDDTCISFRPLVARLGQSDEEWKRVLEAVREAGVLYLSSDTCLMVEAVGKGLKARLVHKDKPRTGWVSLKGPEDLRSSRNAKPIRDWLRKLFKKASREKLETVIAALQDSNLTAMHKTKETEKPNPKFEATEEVDVPVERVEEIARDPAFLYKLGKAIEAAGVVGEEENKRLVWLVVVTGRTRYPRSCVIEGPSRSGKNHIIYVILKFIPREWIFEFTTSTAEAIKYLPEDAEVTLVIYEAVGVRSQTGALGLRAIGEARQIATIYPVRDESTGRMRLEIHRTGARNFVTTTTAVDVEPELLGRTIAVSTDYSKDLTKKVVEKHMREAILNPVFEALGETPYTELKPEEVRAFLRSLDLSLPVIVCAPDITPMFEHLPPELFVTLREHYTTLLDIARVLALIRQKMRPILKVGDKRIVLALPQDILDAWILVGNQLTKTVERMSRRAENVLKLAKELDKGEGFTIRDITARTGMARTTANYILEQLVARGFLRVEKSPGKPNIYHLEKEAEKPDNHRIVGLVTLAFEKGLKTLLSEGCQDAKERGMEIHISVPPETDLNVWVHPTKGDTQTIPISRLIESFIEVLKKDYTKLNTASVQIKGIPLSSSPCHPSEKPEKSLKTEEGRGNLTDGGLSGLVASLAGPTLGECEKAVLKLMHEKRLEGVDWLYEHEITALLGDRFGELLIRGALDSLVKAGKMIREEMSSGIRYRLTR